MVKATVRAVVLVALILGAGHLMAAADFIGEIEIWKWSLGGLVRFIAFTSAAIVAVDYGWSVGDQGKKPVMGSATLSRLAQIVAVGLALWWLYLGMKQVLVEDWLGVTDTVFAILLVALAGYLVWQVYVGFDEISTALQAARRRSTTVRETDGSPGPAGARSADRQSGEPGAEAGTQCPACGDDVPVGQKFCGSCGARIMEA